VKPSITRRCTLEKDFEAPPCASGYQVSVTVCREQPVVNRLTADASTAAAVRPAQIVTSAACCTSTDAQSALNTSRDRMLI